MSQVGDSNCIVNCASISSYSLYDLYDYDINNPSNTTKCIDIIKSINYLNNKYIEDVYSLNELINALIGSNKFCDAILIFINSNHSYYNECDSPILTIGYTRTKIGMERKMIGYMLYSTYIPQNLLHIVSLVVHPNFRKQYIGTELINLGICKSKIYLYTDGSIILHVRKTNNIAKLFYENFGFIFIRVHKNFYSNPKCDGLEYKLMLKTTYKSYGELLYTSF